MKFNYVFRFDKIPTKVELTVNGKQVDSGELGQQMAFTFAMNEIVRLVINENQVLLGGFKVTGGYPDFSQIDGISVEVNQLPPTEVPPVDAAEAEATPPAWPKSKPGDASEPTQPSEPPVVTDPANPDA